MALLATVYPASPCPLHMMSEWRVSPTVFVTFAAELSANAKPGLSPAWCHCVMAGCQRGTNSSASQPCEHPEQQLATAVTAAGASWLHLMLHLPYKQPLFSFRDAVSWFNKVPLIILVCTCLTVPFTFNEEDACRPIPVPAGPVSHSASEPAPSSATRP